MEERDFDKGFQHGVDSVEQKHYHSYVDAAERQAILKERLEQTIEQISGIEKELAKYQSEAEPTLKLKLTHESEVAIAQQQLEQLTKTRETLEQEIAAFEEEKKTKKTPYALLAGIFYFVAGAAFIAGDLIISHEIVAYALNIRNNFEAWAFAVGLASLSILLKPAYERLIEQPYLQNEGKKLYARFQMSLVVFSVLTLAVLGWFRYEAYKTDKLKDGINRQLQAMELDKLNSDLGGATISDTQAIEQMNEKLAAFDKLNLDLVSSPWALWSFVLSGVLFALAGAVCMGIAFPIIQTYWYRVVQLGPRIRRRKRAIKRNQKLYAKLYDGYQKQLAQQQFYGQKLEILGSYQSLKSDKSRLEELKNKLQDELLEANTVSRVENFNDGYSKGLVSRKEMTDEEYEAYRRKNLNAMPKQPAGIRNGVRPHVALRNAITNDMDNN